MFSRIGLDPVIVQFLVECRNSDQDQGVEASDDVGNVPPRPLDILELILRRPCG